MSPDTRSLPLFVIAFVISLYCLVGRLEGLVCYEGVKGCFLWCLLAGLFFLFFFRCCA